MHGVDLVIGLIARHTHSYATCLRLRRTNHSLPHFFSVSVVVVVASHRSAFALSEKPTSKTKNHRNTHIHAGPGPYQFPLNCFHDYRSARASAATNRLFLFGLSLPSGFIIMFSARARSPLSVGHSCPPAPQQQQKHKNRRKKYTQIEYTAAILENLFILIFGGDGAKYFGAMRRCASAFYPCAFMRVCMLRSPRLRWCWCTHKLGNMRRGCCGHETIRVRT